MKLSILKASLLAIITLGIFICFTSARAVTTCEGAGLISNKPCSTAGLTEVEDAENAACPKGFNFEGCSNKPQSGKGVVLCCTDPAHSSSGSSCVPKEANEDKQYLCMTKAACSNVSGKPVAIKEGEAKCGSKQDEVCCETRKRSGESVDESEDAPKAPSSYKLFNPLGKTSLTQIARNVINTFLGILGALALIVFVYGGISYMIAGDIAGGNESGVTNAKNTLKYGVIGIFLIMFSFVLTDTFIKVWSTDLGKPVLNEPEEFLNQPSEAEQELTGLKEQQDAAKQAEKDAITEAKQSKTDVCGQTPATQGYACMTLTSQEQADYDCLSSYCQSQQSASYLCCKEKE